MQTQTHEVIVSYYNNDDSRPFWLPAGQLIVNSKIVASAHDDELSEDESCHRYETTTYAEAAAHFGLTIRLYSEQEIANLLRSSDKAVKVACSRLYDAQSHVNLFATARYDGLKPEQMVEARAEALKHTAYLADLATYKAAQKQVDEVIWNRNWKGWSCGEA